MKFVVSNEGLRAALLAVKAHTSTDKEDLIGRSLVLTVNDAGHLLVTASDGWTSGMARVHIDQDDWSGEVGTLTIDRDQAAQIAGMFHSKLAMLEVTVSSTETPPERAGEKPGIINTVTVRQLGQLFGGDQLRFSTPFQKRDVEGLWHAVGSALRRRPAAIPVTLVSQKRLAAYRAAATAYDEALQISVAGEGGSLLVQCGADFIGFCHAGVPFKDEIVAKERNAWVRELPLKMEAVS
ncbi:hypothetical protein ACSYDW_01260 [Paeniglutamicibacter sp. R2-26]|uniref:hypothetical protein n=1 Tax=Paeniglutamicibacter sp. R2-26 TaxID=3144417 RepID=UPI003EE79D61